jgi:hypothetical protein
MDAKTLNQSKSLPPAEFDALLGALLAEKLADDLRPIAEAKKVKIIVKVTKAKKG